MAALHRLKRRVRVLTAQKRRLVWELRAAQAVPANSPQMHYHPQPKK